MNRFVEKVLFDPQDHELLKIVNDVLNRDKTWKHFKKLFGSHLHPHGIKEMAAPKELRIAYAVIQLLDALTVGKAEERLIALRSVMDEVLHIAESSLRKNTARVLLQIMKDLVRAHGNYQRQLELAHDFRRAASGKPRIIREQLRRFHLLEMSEEWNQVTFDDHVHDANTKGRKSATHLIMDAWIKGIRSLIVIYYNYVTPEAAAEALEAAEIMGITVRIGLELSARFRDKYVQFIWGPRGFLDAQDFLEFLENPSVREFMEESRKVSQYQQRYVFACLQAFNEQHRLHINETYNIDLAPITEEEFLAFVAPGQPSLLHLSELIHTRLLPLLETHIKALRTQSVNATLEEQEQLLHVIRALEALGAEEILQQYLRPEQNPTIPNPNIPQNDDTIPEMLTLSPYQLLERLNQLHSGYRITLNLNELTVEDVLELLYDCQGMITHLEIFNLKDYVTGKMTHHAKINALQLAINEGNVIKLKRLIREILQQVEVSEQADKDSRIEKLTMILRNISTLKDFYKMTPLKSHIGSDSTGRLSHLYGMGLAVKETLPPRSQRECEASLGLSREIIPVSTTVHLQVTYIPPEGLNRKMKTLYQRVWRIPGFRFWRYRRKKDWEMQVHSHRMEAPGNIVTLGGMREVNTPRFAATPPATRDVLPNKFWRYANYGLANGLKVLIGFIPAFVTFALTMEWWPLKYFGAVIWFGITGFRNILQSVLGGGGFRRSPLLTWSDYVSWGRLADSLLFTGFSVPLLDYVVKTVLLDQTFGITTTTNSDMLYTIMALVNGLYLSGHNAFRGLPKTAIFGNFFRSILSIPIAIVFNMLIGNILASMGMVGVNNILQKWATVISKAASDCVAGVIEGVADRYQNMRIRSLDYEGKLMQLRDAYAQLEILFPETDVMEMLKSPKEFIKEITTKAKKLEKIIIINALDLMYFWMYQPRARSVLRKKMRSMSTEEIQILAHSQYVLQRQREISKFFVNGLIGKNFSRALSFYLDRSEEYIKAINKLADTCIQRRN
ncbi:hypothetical protein U27_02324 [Candidatus Vecturithrix granuli]|uniref:Uncharacterized protein n=1 Tax=Vecturithrix granuli TaxID=1499967 RepID=A0A0S6WAE6_VECG1|nr:hypothetical protein U27_02324 [Candidatus Vecturithrix granuli]